MLLPPTNTLCLVRTAPLGSLWHSHHQKQVRMLLSRVAQFRSVKRHCSQGRSRWPGRRCCRKPGGACAWGCTVLIPLSPLWLFWVWFILFAFCTASRFMFTMDRLEMTADEGFQMAAVFLGSGVASGGLSSGIPSFLRCGLGLDFSPCTQQQLECALCALRLVHGSGEARVSDGKVNIMHSCWISEFLCNRFKADLFTCQI